MKNLIRLYILLAFFVILIYAAATYAHDTVQTDSSGCHYVNSLNKQDYHCHEEVEKEPVDTWVAVGLVAVTAGAFAWWAYSYHHKQDNFTVFVVPNDELSGGSLEWRFHF